MDTSATSATVAPSRRFSPVWIIPIVSVIAAGWMIYRYLQEQGPQIYLTVQTAEGIVAGKTLIKARSVKVGMVTEVKLSKNYHQIELTARMDGGTERMLRKNSEFWVVKPRIGTGGVTGLETLLSGPYIQLEPGDSTEKQSHFVMLNSPPIAGPDTRGIQVTLFAPGAGKLDVGDPVMYQGYVVGRVEKVGFDVDKRHATYQLFIFQPYEKLLRTRSRFWLNSGFDVTLNAEGFNIQVASLETLISGGVTFAVPEGSPEGQPLGKDIPSFRLYDNLADVRANIYQRVIPYAMLFNSSVRGLSVGAPVEYRGIRIGTVTEVPILASTANAIESTQIPVLINIELERIEQFSAHEFSLAEFRQRLSNAIAKGLRASLKTGNLLSGALYIDINFYPDETKQSSYTKEATLSGYDLIPTVAGGFAVLEQQVQSIMTKLEQLPLDTTMKQLNRTLASFAGAGRQLDATLKELDTLLTQKETQQLPKSLQQTLSQARSTLSGYGPGSTSYAEVEQTLTHINEVIKQLEPLLQTLNETPDALIFGARETADPVPVKGAKQ